MGENLNKPPWQTLNENSSDAKDIVHRGRPIRKERIPEGKDSTHKASLLVLEIVSFGWVLRTAVTRSKAAVGLLKRGVCTHR
jgi:hypothetical protein